MDAPRAPRHHPRDGTRHAVLSLAWLWPQTPSRIVEVPLDSLEIGVPEFIRPFEMGGEKDRQNGIWLVRFGDGGVRSFWSQTAHPGGCVIEPARVPYVPLELLAPPPSAAPTAVATARPPRSDYPATEPGFLEPCLGSTFRLDGTRTFGPAPFGLDSFPTTIEDDIVRIDTSRITVGVCSGTTYRHCSTPDSILTRRVAWPRGP